MEVEEDQPAEERQKGPDPAEERQKGPDTAEGSGVLSKRKLVAGNVTEMVEVAPKKLKVDHSQYPSDSVTTSHTVGGPSDVLYCPSPSGNGSRPTSTHSSRDGFTNPHGQTPTRGLNLSQDPLDGWNFGLGGLGPVFQPSRGGRTPVGSPRRPIPTFGRSPAAGGRRRRRRCSHHPRLSAGTSSQCPYSNTPEKHL
jgi:hypothetical protein